MDIKADLKTAEADLDKTIATDEAKVKADLTSAKSVINAAKGWLIATAFVFLVIGILLGHATAK